jgi:hypothetical protein
MCGVSEFKHVCLVGGKNAARQRLSSRQSYAKKRGMTDEEVRLVFGPIADVLRGVAP